jgi:pilus assembly protein Flp/PilA
MEKLMFAVQRFMKDEEGVTMVEYGLIAALIAIVCLLAVTTVGNNLNIAFETICNALGKAVVGGATC